jgi:hypothetical protein
VKNSSTSAPKPTFTHELVDDDKTMPLGVGDASAEDQALDPLAGTGEARRFKTGSILIVVVVAIACGGLWFMRSLSHVSAATSGKSEAEQTIEEFLVQRDSKGNPKNGGNSSAVLEVLRDSYIDRQVPLEDVQKDPFLLPGEGEIGPVGPIDTGESTDKVLAKARVARQQEIAAAAERLELKSVMMASQPLANVSGMLVREGDELSPEGSEVVFRVQKIESDSMLLLASDIALGLNVEVPLTMRRDK